jgi:hypothetical protein
MAAKFSLLRLRNFLTELHAQLTLTSLPGIFWERFGCKIQSISPEKFPHLTTVHAQLTLTSLSGIFWERFAAKFSLLRLRNFLTELHAQLTLTSLLGIFWERFGCKIQFISPERSLNSNINFFTNYMPS